MAVNVETWEDFLEAASGNDPTLEINLPNEALWDLGEIEPEGHTGYIKLTGQINGNGTKIKNLIIQNGTGSNGVFDVNGTVTDLHFADGVWTPQTGAIVRHTTADSIVQLCTFSASIQGSGTFTLFGSSAAGKTIAYRCAANIELATGDGLFLTGNNVDAKYLNVKVAGTRVNLLDVTMYSGSAIYGQTQYSYVVADTPAVQTVRGSNFKWSVLRCNGANVSSLAQLGDLTGYTISLACSNDFPNVGTISNGLRLCTEQQLHDAAYLQSIGFPIGVET